MPELVGAFFTEALGSISIGAGLWLLIAAVLAGLARGFAGFGTAMVFLPMACMVVSPISAIIILTVIDFFGPIPLLKRMLRDSHPGELMRLCWGMLLGVPLGVSVLLWIPETSFRWGASILVLVVALVLWSGWRWAKRLSHPQLVGVGLFAGLLGGGAGLPGPAVVTLYMGGPYGIVRARANNFLFLFAFDIVMLFTLLYRGALEVPSALLGAALIVPYTAAIALGGLFFREQHEQFFRRMVYAMIFGSALVSLPLWGL